MNSRERVLLSMNFKQPDQGAIDFGAHRSSGIAAMAYVRLRDYLGLLKRPPRCTTCGSNWPLLTRTCWSVSMSMLLKWDAALPQRNRTGTNGPCRMDNYLMLLAAEPDLVHRFLDKLVSIYLKRLEMYLKAVGPYIDLILFSDDYGMQTGVPPENIVAMFDAIAEWNGNR